MRYERKYRIEATHPQVVSMVIRQHPAGFRPLFPPRQINNLYFDTPDFAAFQDNVTGTPQRLKYRLRWYGDDFSSIRNPVLEVKIKDNLVGWKQHYPLPEGGYGASDWEKLVRLCRETLQKGLDLMSKYPSGVPLFWYADDFDIATNSGIINPGKGQRHYHRPLPLHRDIKPGKLHLWQ